jgi:hypothetical protein
VRSEEAAGAWADAWERGWRTHDPEPIAARYAPTALVRTHPFRDAAYGPEGIRGYAVWAFAEEEEILDVGFGDPIADGDRAAVEYWAAVVSGGRQQTIRGVSLLRFDDDGLVVEHRDFWASADV